VSIFRADLTWNDFDDFPSEDIIDFVLENASIGLVAEFQIDVTFYWRAGDPDRDTLLDVAKTKAKLAYEMAVARCSYNASLGRTLFDEESEEFVDDDGEEVPLHRFYCDANIVFSFSKSWTCDDIVSLINNTAGKYILSGV